MNLADATSIFVEIRPPDSPFGGAKVETQERNIQFEFNSNPAAVTSIFGRTGDVLARSSDYSEFYAPLGGELPPGGLDGQVLTKLSSSDRDVTWADPAGGLANPSVLIGMTAKNGTALTGIRSDGAPAIDPDISPDWTGDHVFHGTCAVQTPTLNQHAANKSYVDSAVGGGVTPAALSTADDTNVTASLTGSPTNCLLQAVGLHLGWTGTLSKARGGTGQSNQSIPAHSYFGNNTGSTAAGGFNQIDYSELTGTPTAITPAALTKTDDTNVTATLVGTPATALLQAVQINLGWTGTLSKTRGGLGVSANGIAAHTFFGNNTGSSGNGAFVQPNISDILGDTSTALGIGSLELGHASDTTLSRLSAGVLGVEGVAVLLSGGALGTPSSGNLSNCTFPTLNQNTTGSAAKWTTARNLAGNSVDGSANVAFANAFIVQGTADTGLSAAQFLGALGTGILKNTTTTGILSIAVAGDFPTLNQNTTGSAASLSISGQSGLLTFLGLTSTNRAKTLRDAADTILELGGSYSPSGTWTSLTMVTPVLGTPASGNLANCNALPISGLTASTSTAIGVGSVELGHASDTTLSRSAAGIMAVEGIDMPPRYTIRAASIVTQASDTNPHAVFTTPANGRFTPPSTGTWHFEAVLQYSSMSGTSGNLKIDILGAGTATCTNWSWQAWGNDNTSNPSAVGGSLNTTSASPASIVSAGTGTTLGVTIRGSVEVTGLGTLIPTQTLVTAASAVLGVGSFFTFWRAGATGMSSVGPWD